MAHYWMVFVVFIMISCQQKQELPVSVELPAAATTAYQEVMVETPLGAYQALQFDPVAKHINLNGQQDRLILPYVANAALINVSPKDGMQWMRVWLIGPRLAPGTLESVKLLGVVSYNFRGQLLQELVAVPSDASRRSIMADDFTDLITSYEPAKFILEYWLRNRYGQGDISELRWEDEQSVVTFINGG